MKRLIIFSIFLLLLSCNKTKDISGHWHIRREKPIDDSYITMDLSDDSIAFAGKNSIYGTIEGFYNQKEKIIFFPGDCGAFQFEYEIQGDRLYLKNYLENHIAERCDSNCCNKLIDFKNDLKLDISFPQISQNRDSLKPIELFERSLIENIIIGNTDKTYDCNWAKDVKILLNEKHATLEGINAWVELVRIRQQESKRDRINYRIIADEEITTNELKPLINELEKNGAKRIFLTCLKENYQTEDEIFEYVYIKNINLDGYKELKEILN